MAARAVAEEAAARVEVVAAVEARAVARPTLRAPRAINPVEAEETTRRRSDPNWWDQTTASVQREPGPLLFGIRPRR